MLQPLLESPLHCSKRRDVVFYAPPKVLAASRKCDSRIFSEVSRTAAFEYVVLGIDTADTEEIQLNSLDF